MKLLNYEMKENVTRINSQSKSLNLQTNLNAKNFSKMKFQ